MRMTATEDYARALLAKRAKDMEEIIREVLRYGNNVETIQLLVKTGECCKACADLICKPQ